MYLFFVFKTVFLKKNLLLGTNLLGTNVILSFVFIIYKNEFLFILYPSRKLPYYFKNDWSWLEVVYLCIDFIDFARFLDSDEL